MSDASKPERFDRLETSQTGFDWEGHADRQADGTLQIWIQDSWGWRINLTGVRDVENGGFTLTGKTDSPPNALKIPGLDDGE
jgi:hypothetical protein